MIQLKFPIKEFNSYHLFKEALKDHGIIQPSILLKSYVLAFGFGNDVTKLLTFLEQVKSTWQFNKLSSNEPRQMAYLSTIVYNEIKHIEEAVRADNLGIL